jgi:lysyl-tRNA synthetase class 2
MPSIEKLIQERKRKRDKIVDSGMDPYPVSCHRTHSITDVEEDFSALEDEEERLWVAGRILAIREHGSVVFFDLFDGSGEIQVVLKEDEFEDTNQFDLFIDAVDVGDFVEVAGHATETKTGQASIAADKWRMLSKALRPIPSQWSGLEDTETRLRKRYIDILMNEEVREMVYQRSRFWRAIREFFQEREFVEVQTPILETTPGGADARAFQSHHNALDMDVYLRISAGELWQKKLLVGGLEKVFEVGRIFRNEGISPEHAQDYMQMEFYWAYADHEDGKALVRKLYRHIAESVFSKTKFEIRGHDVDLSEEWEEYDYVDTIQSMTGCDVANADLKSIKDVMKENGITISDDINRQRAIDNLWKYCRKQISGPAFLVNIPKEMSPLAKTKEDRPETAAQFQPLIAGSEVGKGYSELNNPTEQKQRLQHQQELREEGDDEAQRFDEDFVEALEHGMPPACGFGVSERLFAFMVDKPIREAQIFPLLRPKQD